MLFPLIKAGEEAELGEVYFYGGYERPGVDIDGPWSIDFPLEHYPSAVLEWTGTLAGRRWITSPSPPLPSPWTATTPAASARRSSRWF